MARTIKKCLGSRTGIRPTQAPCRFLQTYWYQRTIHDFHADRHRSVRHVARINHRFLKNHMIKKFTNNDKTKNIPANAFHNYGINLAWVIVTWAFMIFRMLPAGYKSSQTCFPGSNLIRARFVVQLKPIPKLRMFGVIHMSCISLPWNSEHLR